MSAYLCTTGLLLVAFCAAEAFSLSKTLEQRVSNLERTCLRQSHAVEAIMILAGTPNRTVLRASVKGCPDRFDREYNDYCYFFSDNAVSWDVAKLECSELDEDAYLAEIMNSDEA